MQAAAGRGPDIQTKVQLCRQGRPARQMGRGPARQAGRGPGIQTKVQLCRQGGIQSWSGDSHRPIAAAGEGEVRLPPTGSGHGQGSDLTVHCMLMYDNTFDAIYIRARRCIG